MSLFLQDLVDRGIWVPPSRTMIIRAQNVADYLFTQSDKEEWDDGDFPCISPPSPSTWIEWKTPAFSNSGGTLVKMPRKRNGVLIATIDGWSATDRLAWFAAHSSSLYEVPKSVSDVERWFGPPAESRWFCVAKLITEIDGVLDVLGMAAYGVHEDGQFCRYGAMGKYAILLPTHISNYTMPSYPENFPGDKCTDVEDFLSTRISVGLFVPFLALSYMHCKNVTVEKSAPIPPALARSRVKNGKPPIMRFHTIRIDSMGRKTTYPAAEAGLGRDEAALHICRGHFKRFGDRGLFGKWRGMFWWPMHVRGNRERGVVLSDYEVKGGLR